MADALAHAKINLGLCVGPLRPDGLHEVATVMQRLELADTLRLEPAPRLSVLGFAEDTLVREALDALAAAAGTTPAWRAEIAKRIPVAAGLGGGSSDAAAALRLANTLLETPLQPARLTELARRLGSDVPFFLTAGPQLATGSGAELEPLTLPQDYSVVLFLPRGEHKPSTASVYARFAGEQGFAGRRQRLLDAAARGALGELPGNDLVRSPHTERLRALGAFRAEVSGAGPALYGLFYQAAEATAAAGALESLGAVWLTRPAW